ncbi:MAG: hypothetical protein HY763_00105 [Planctomycetes bacterium]|nr:hypothetical protein [Planctomycetota bacterium]
MCTTPIANIDIKRPFITLGIHCPTCGYLLRGLPYQGRCPECGGAYVAEDPTPERVVEAYFSAVPRLWRLAMDPPRRVVGPNEARGRGFFVAAMLVTAYFLAISYACSVVGFQPGEGSPGIHTRTAVAVLRYKYTGVKVRPNVDGALIVGGLALAGQFLLAALVRSAYWLTSRRAPRHREVVQRLGTCAKATVPWAMLLPMTTVAVWQAINVHFIGYGGPVICGTCGEWFSPDLIRSIVRGMDGVGLIGLWALVISSTIAGTRLYLINRDALRAVRTALSGVRPVLLDGSLGGAAWNSARGTATAAP